jgi:quercetin dioxygenase-like cupin family protein
MTHAAYPAKSAEARLSAHAATEWFDNPAIGQRTRLVRLPRETGGRSAVIEYEFEPFKGERAVPEHYHPHADEHFEILGGKAAFRIGGILGSAGAGDTVVMPRGVAHVHPYSASAEPLVVRQTILLDPPDERGLTASIQGALTIFGLARDGKVSAAGMPSLLQLAVIMSAAMPMTYVAGVPAGVQRVLLTALGAIGRGLGYRHAYPRHGVLTAAGFVGPRQER